MDQNSSSQAPQIPSSPPVVKTSPETIPSNLYPQFSIDKIQNPNRLFAIPLLGFIIKVILLIPVFLFLVVISFVTSIVCTINSLVVLFTGNYWDTAYTYAIGYLRLSAKVGLYIAGLTDKYPGFSLSTEDAFILDMPKPASPNRLFAIPFLGFFIRIILIIPFAIFQTIIGQGAWVGMIISSFSVLFKGTYPESTYELYRDGMRLQLAASAYFMGLSDSYPSFWISMNHKTVKVVLIILGTLLFLINIVSGALSEDKDTNYPRYSPTQALDGYPRS